MFHTQKCGECWMMHIYIPFQLLVNTHKIFMMLFDRLGFVFCINLPHFSIIFLPMRCKLGTYPHIHLTYNDSYYFYKVISQIDDWQNLPESFVRHHNLWVDSALYNVICLFSTMWYCFLLLISTSQPNFNDQSWYALNIAV